MQFHQIKSQHTNNKKKRVGRGGKRGTYSGKGLKGQKSRAGKKMRPQMRDIIKKIPKKRGYRFASIQKKPSVINVGEINAAYEDGQKVSPKTLLEKKLIKRMRGRHAHVKILGKGALEKKLTVSGCLVSKSAKEIIEKAGGNIKTDKHE